jgi:hypothetical protein
MTWNYRLVKIADDEYGICEVFYGEDGKPWGRTDPVAVSGESVEECLGDFRGMMEAFILGVLDDAEIARNPPFKAELDEMLRERGQPTNNRGGK